MIVKEKTVPSRSDTNRKGFMFLCPVCNSPVQELIKVVSKNYDSISMSCERCGFKWNPSQGNIIECAERYKRNHPEKACMVKL